MQYYILTITLLCLEGTQFSWDRPVPGATGNCYEELTRRHRLSLVWSVKVVQCPKIPGQTMRKSVGSLGGWWVIHGTIPRRNNSWRWRNRISGMTMTMTTTISPPRFLVWLWLSTHHLLQSPSLSSTKPALRAVRQTTSGAFQKRLVHTFCLRRPNQQVIITPDMGFFTPSRLKHVQDAQWTSTSPTNP